MALKTGDVQTAHDELLTIRPQQNELSPKHRQIWSRKLKDAARRLAEDAWQTEREGFEAVTEDEDALPSVELVERVVGEAATDLAREDSFARNREEARCAEATISTQDCPRARH